MAKTGRLFIVIKNKILCTKFKKKSKGGSSKKNNKAKTWHILANHGLFTERMKSTLSSMRMKLTAKMHVEQLNMPVEEIVNSSTASRGV